MPLISVLIPCYNASRWLKRAIRSIQLQSERDLEIIVYNDGSSDDSSHIIQDMAANDHRIRLMGEPVNQGTAYGLNKMLDVAQGHFIARMDSDDISLTNRLYKQLEFVKCEAVDLCGAWFREFGGGIARNVQWYTSSEEIRAALLFQNTICHPTVFARREVFEKFRYREGYKQAQDYDLITRASSEFRLANVPAVLLRYRRHRQQATRARRSNMEKLAGGIRIQALRALGIEPTLEECRIHNLIRGSKSIVSMEDLTLIEIWLLKLLERFDQPSAKRVVAEQWTRASIRAAPLGFEMWRKYRSSRLHNLLKRRNSENVDLAILAALRVDYGSHLFETLRRFGLSA